MKKTIFFLILVSTALLSKAQVDSSTLFAGSLTLRTNDWELVNRRIAFNSTVETLSDSVKIRMRAYGANYPAGTTTWSVNITNGDAVTLNYLLRTHVTTQNASVVSRVLTAIRAINSTYINSRMDALDTAESNELLLERSLGKKWGRKE